MAELQQTAAHTHVLVHILMMLEGDPVEAKLDDHFGSVAVSLVLGIPEAQVEGRGLEKMIKYIK